MDVSVYRKKHANVIPFLQNGDYFFHRGIDAYKKKNLKRAVTLFERAVKLTDKEPVFQIQLAAVLSELNEYERSNDILRDVLHATSDNHPECHFFMANNYAYLGNFGLAEQSVKTYLKNTTKEDRLEGAEELLEMLSEEELVMDDESEELENLISGHTTAGSFLKQNKPKQAIPVLQEMIDDHPTCWAAYNHLAEAYFRSGQQSKAFDLSEKVLTEDKGNLFALCNIALFTDELGDDKEARRYAQTLSQVYPIDTDHYLKLARVLCALGEYQETEKRLSEVDTLTFDMYPELYDCRGVAQFNLGQIDRAEVLWRKATKKGYSKSEQRLKNIEDLKQQDVTYRLWP
ncbi:tetratricopeptide repeat protein [Alkalicoccobacillus murimartini]|uniref:Tetratricopeptide (TPR) repeat protein n=1 Tax=Alkalicoccobacillus murimartini TaxID=171685 RepID=A0ABT9YFT6_9BACI|nr:tetratricopeptide repeat protein [Alkalicoccobacillus murimartini]MDQ0206702.1 tetratricopeptide (TPR) repeat protein [Alkalicoccobacillus murimartini]